MRLVSVCLQGMRAYIEPQVIPITDLTVILGQNDAGKSTLLDALDIFFNEPKGQPENDDFNVADADDLISISCTFEDVPESLVLDEVVPTTLDDEYLLNADGHLEIKKVFKKGSSKARVFAVAHHPQHEDCDDLLTQTIAKLKAKAKQLGVNLDQVDQRVSTEIRRAIWRSVEDLQLATTDVELAKESAKTVWDKIKPQLPVYALFKSDRPSTDQDAEAQDPMKIAIKEAIATQQETLDQIQRTVESQVQTIANETVAKLMEMAPDLARTLNPRVKTKNWDTLFNVSLTGDDSIPINKRGSGTRRLVLLNFFRAKAEQDSKGKGTGVIYAIEEPETSQHPNNQRMLVDAFEDLVSDGSCQILLTTHTPVLARRFSRDRLRIIRLENGCSVADLGSNDQALQKIVNSLGVIPSHEVKIFVGVEGKHDINFLCTIADVLRNEGENVPDLRTAEDDGHLVFIPCGGSSVELWVSRLAGFSVPEFYLFDRDNPPPSNPHYHTHALAINARENAVALHTSKRELENYLHPDVLRAACPNYSGQGSDFEDVPSLFAQAVYEQNAVGSVWADLDGKIQKKKCSNAKRRLNGSIAETMTGELLTNSDPQGDVRNWLERIRQKLEA